MDNLKTHTPASLLETLSLDETRRSADRLDIHHTPKHSSRLNVAEIERHHRTIGEQINEEELEDLTRVEAVIAGIIDACNHVRVYSSLSLLRPVDSYRGNPEALPVERRRKLQATRELRQQRNIKLRQRLIPWAEDQTVPYSEAAIVSL